MAIDNAIYNMLINYDRKVGETHASMADALIEAAEYVRLWPDIACYYCGDDASSAEREDEWEEPVCEKCKAKRA